MSQPGGPFIVRALRTDPTLPPQDEPFARFGPALARAQEIASALGYRSAELSDQRGTIYATFYMLWAIPREVR